MSDEVKFIFKTLIKVPCIIFVCYFIFNVFAFFFIYFKILGLSYIVMEEVVENNYIPNRQVVQLNDYFADINNIMLAQNTSLIVGEDSSGNPIYLGTDGNYYSCNNNTQVSSLNTSVALATQRVQYGQDRVVGIHCEYTLVWPLSYNIANNNNNGVNGNNGGLYNSIESVYDADSDTYNNVDITYNEDGTVRSSGTSTEHDKRITIPLNIFYNVPGLKYYADL